MVKDLFVYSITWYWGNHTRHLNSFKFSFCFFGM